MRRFWASTCSASLTYSGFALMLLAMAATYDPAPSAPYGVRLPCDAQTCDVVADTVFGQQFADELGAGVLGDELPWHDVGVVLQPGQQDPVASSGVRQHPGQHLFGQVECNQT